MSTQALPFGWAEILKDLPDLMIAKEVAFVMRRSVKTVYKFAERGILIRVKIGSAILFPKAGIIAYLEKQTFLPRQCKKREQMGVDRQRTEQF